VRTRGGRQRRQDGGGGGGGGGGGAGGARGGAFRSTPRGRAPAVTRRTPRGRQASRCGPVSSTEEARDREPAAGTLGRFVVGRRPGLVAEDGADGKFEAQRRRGARGGRRERHGDGRAHAPGARVDCPELRRRERRAAPAPRRERPAPRAARAFGRSSARAQWRGNGAQGRRGGWCTGIGAAHLPLAGPRGLAARRTTRGCARAPA
jgi:hypothetical protein